jgi:hypothetical protein
MLGADAMNVGSIDFSDAIIEQLDNGRSRRGEGTGIGLPLSKALVEMMGGRLTLTSQEGIGTTFHVRLPMASQSTITIPAEIPPSALNAVALRTAGDRGN